MLTTHELVDRLTSVAIGRLTILQFEDWFVPRSWSVTNWGTPEMRAAVYELELALAEYSNKHVDASYVRVLSAKLAGEIKNRSSIFSSSIAERIPIAEIMRARVPALRIAAAA